MDLVKALAVIALAAIAAAVLITGLQGVGNGAQAGQDAWGSLRAQPTNTSGSSAGLSPWAMVTTTLDAIVPGGIGLMASVVSGAVLLIIGVYAFKVVARILGS